MLDNQCLRAFYGCGADEAAFGHAAGLYVPHPAPPNKTVQIKQALRNGVAGFAAASASVTAETRQARQARQAGAENMSAAP